MTKIGSTSVGYRADIDGLRAIAVGAVLLFHAHLGMPGGFVGVDVFFVISGFLITSIILKDAASDRGFRLFHFWERRIRRILPPLFIVILSTVVAGWFILLPSDFLELGKSVLAQAAFVGNFYFWLSGGYFAQPAGLKPLLHTWSLAAEEQYYVFFPLLFLLGGKWKIATFRWMIGLAALLSLALSIVSTKAAPDAAFYLLPSRAWELFGGALLAMTPCQRDVPRLFAEAVGWAGVCAIGIAFWRYDRGTSFPGFAAVLPCAGTLAIIWANGLGRRSASVGRLLALGPLVFIGRISYSLYLWHWPLLVYAAYWQNNSIIRGPVRVGLLGLSALLAVASWKFIETPFRTRRVLPGRRAIFAFGLVTPMGCAILGAALVLSHGVPARFRDAVVRCDEARLFPAGPAISRAEVLSNARKGTFPRRGRAGGPVHCLVWGDSHAMAVSPAVAKVAEESSSSVEFAMYPATPPLLDYESRNPESLRGDSIPWSEAIVEHVRRQQIADVLLVANWTWYFGSPTSDSIGETNEGKVIADKLAATIVALRQTGAKVWMMKTVPAQPVAVPMGMAKALLDGRSIEIGIAEDKYSSFSRLEDEMLAPAVARGAMVLDPAPYFFDGRTTCLVESSGFPLYSDDNHLNARGAAIIEGLFRPIWSKNSFTSGN